MEQKTTVMTQKLAYVRPEVRVYNISPERMTATSPNVNTLRMDMATDTNPFSSSSSRTDSSREGYSSQDIWSEQW